MERSVFAKGLREAAESARDFARQYLIEDLPEAMRFRVRLNRSYDGNPLHPDEVVYPEDSGREPELGLIACTLECAVEALWREGRVPEWINVAVTGLVGDATLMELVSCGRYTSNPQLLYVHPGGRTLFHPLGPPLPEPLEWDGKKFSIYRLFECWTRLDLGRAEPHAHRIWSLELVGDTFIDAALAELPNAVNLEILSLKRSPITGVGLAELQRLETLRVLRIELARPEVFRLDDLPPMSSIESLQVSFAPDRPWGFGLLAERLPRLDILTLITKGRLHLDGRCPRVFSGTAVSGLTIYAREIAPLTAVLPERTDHLGLHLMETTEADLERLLEPVAHVTRLSLEDCCVGDRLALALAARWPLESLRLARTRVSPDTLRELQERYPRMRLRPKPARVP